MKKPNKGNIAKVCVIMTILSKHRKHQNIANKKLLGL
jgi:hypothetical protein